MEFHLNSTGRHGQEICIQNIDVKKFKPSPIGKGCEHFHGTLLYVAGNVLNFIGQFQINELDVFSCKLCLFPCAEDYSSFVAK